MSTVTLRLPEEKHSRLKQMAKSRRLSVNKLMDELATVALTAYDANLRFHALAARGDQAYALSLLDKLDTLDQVNP